MSEFFVHSPIHPSEVTRLIEIALSRRLVNRDAGVEDQMIGFRDPLEIEIDGVLGEFAVCKYLNRFFDMSAEPRSGGIDCVYMGLSCDVKTRPYKNNQALQVPQHKDKGDTDIFILVEIEKNQAHILGFAPRENIFRPENLKPSVREGKFHYELPWAKLTPIGDLFEYAIQKSQVAGLGERTVVRDVWRQ